jgi:hypothetical protein
MPPSTQWIGGWVGPIASLDTMEKRKILPCQESNLGHPARRPLLYQLSYRHSCNAEFNRNIPNSSTFYQIIKGILWNNAHKVHFTLITTFSTETWIVTNGNKGKIQAMDMKVFVCIKGNKRGQNYRLIF